MPYTSHTDRQAASRRYYEKNAELVKQRRYASKERNQMLVLAYLKQHPCVDCGEDDPVVLHFDHRNPASKTALITDLIRAGASQDRLHGEIAKCDVRCANCHARRTARQFNHYKTRHVPIV